MVGDEAAYRSDPQDICRNGEGVGELPLSLKLCLLVGREVRGDGNTTSGDGCSSDCLSAEVCGDRIVNVDEVCDDGNLVDDLCCSTDCQDAPFSCLFEEEPNNTDAEASPTDTLPFLISGFYDDSGTDIFTLQSTAASPGLRLSLLSDPFVFSGVSLRHAGAEVGFAPSLDSCCPEEIQVAGGLLPGQSYQLEMFFFSPPGPTIQYLLLVELLP